MKKALSFILTPIFFLFFGLLLVIFHPIQIIAKSIFGSKAHDKSVALLNFLLMRDLSVLGTRLNFVNFKQMPESTEESPVIIISNHQSMWDIPSIVWKFRKLRPKFIAKKELAKFIPSVSYNLKHGGSVAIDRNKPDEAVQKIKDFAKKIKKNHLSVCIFPEGTRSRDGKIKSFKISGIRALLAEMPNATFVPVAVKNTGKIDNYGKFLKNIGTKVSFTLLAPRKIAMEVLESELEKIRREMIAIVEG